MKLEPGKLYRSKNNHSICFVLISLGALAGHDSLNKPYVNGCHAFFPSRGIVERISIWCSDLEDMEEL